MDAPAPFDRALALAATVGALAGYWLDVRCRCGSVTLVPLHLLATEGQRSRTIADVVLKLRCLRCDQAPGSVVLIENTSGQGIKAYGGPPP